MKTVVGSTFLILALAANAQAPVPTPLARGDAPGEPHHHLKIENEFVRAYYVEVPPHENTQLHQHDNDYVFISLGASDIINAPLNKPETRLTMSNGEVHFSRGSFAHMARNLADTPFRNITIEFLKPQGNVRNRCRKVIPNEQSEICDPPTKTDRSGAEAMRLFQTSEMVADDYWVGASVSAHLKAKDGSLVVAYDDSPIKVEIPDKPALKLVGGDLLWVEAGNQFKISSLEKSNTSFCLVISFDPKTARKRF